jgi:dTDP-4-dehydrorhamnose reductase
MNDPKILVLGHRGMLGHAVTRRLREEGFAIRTTDVRHGGDELIEEVAASDVGAVVNCLGVSASRASGPEELFSTNALLPQRLAAVLGPTRLLIHASTDGVFDGRRGSYAASEPTNASDPYGLSKRLGELARHVGRVVIVRCSVIGLDLGRPRSLLSWLLNQTSDVVGFTNHIWNGLTSLEWAKIAVRALRNDPTIAPGIHQPACARPVSKYALLNAAARAFRHEVAIAPQDDHSPVDRTLIPTIACPPVEQQLEELRSWYEQERSDRARVDSDPHP